MISKFARAQKSWIAKLILTLTALSFMSLFGITGYLSSASENRTVIKVDGFETSQAEFSYEFQKELNAAKNIMNIDFNDEENDGLRSELMNVVAKRMVQNAIIDRTAQKYHVLFSRNLIGQVIRSDASFHDLTGKFNPDLFRRVLSENSISESEYVKSVERGLAEQILTIWPVQHIVVPEVMIDAELQIDNKRRTFKYAIIDPEEMQIDRDISNEETEQYYEDFAPTFVAPETRDLSIVYVSVDDISSKMVIPSEDIKAYYDEHITNYEQPEKREVLQMMFDTESAANAAYIRLGNGEDFYQVAEEDAHQSKSETELGVVSEDELVFEIAEDVFALSEGEYTKPVQVGDIWQIMKVVKVTAPTKTDYAVASEEIRTELLNERLYDEIYDVLSKMEDEIGAGKSLEDIATDFNTNIVSVKGFSDDGKASEAPSYLSDLLKSSEFIDTVFSYAVGETSQTIEGDEGLAIVRIDDVHEMRTKDIDEVRAQIKQMWQENEKTVMAREKANDIISDVENGDDFSDTVRRYGLPVLKSQPVTRNETFSGLTYADMKELFAQQVNTPYQTIIGQKYVVVLPDEEYENSVPLGDDEKKLVKNKMQQSYMADLQKALLDSYAKDYNIKIKYDLMGIAE